MIKTEKSPKENLPFLLIPWADFYFYLIGNTEMCCGPNLVETCKEEMRGNFIIVGTRSDESPTKISPNQRYCLLVCRYSQPVEPVILKLGICQRVICLPGKEAKNGESFLFVSVGCPPLLL